MPSNLELKSRLRTSEEAEAAAGACGAEYQRTLHQRDTYFAVLRGRLKLREETSGGAELIFYERDEATPERWSDYWKSPVDEPDVLKMSLSRALGVLATVEKERRLYFYRGARVHLDNVEGLGSFVEFEVPRESSPAPELLMEELRRAFHIHDDLIEKRSYSDLILSKSSSLGA
jgi:adenylate cyclase class 2